MKNPEISVIIPTYNYANFIREALDSVFNQTFQDFEIIVVDDGSTDDTKAIIESYGDRVIYISQKNQGPAIARNTGIMSSRGTYIAFLDADDLWYPDKLEKQIALFKANPKLGMVLADNALFDDEGIYKNYVGKKAYLFDGDLVTNIFLRSGVVTPTVIVKREAFDKVGLFEEGLFIAEDDNMWIRIACEFDVDIVDEALAQIRNHRTRTMSVSTKLVESVENNIKLLTTKYGPKVASKIAPLAARKYNQLYFDEGYKHFENQDYRRARKLFFKATKYRKGHWKAFAYIIITLIPSWLMSALRSLKRRLLPSSYNSPKWTRA